MRIIKIASIVIAVILILQILAVGINILQNGPGKWDGRTVDEILGIETEKATVADIEKLSKSDVMQLFFAADSPVFINMKGEYKAKLVPVGIFYNVSEYYSHHFMGPGRWEAKCFYPIEERKGQGYNLFTVFDDGKSKSVRTLRMDTFVGPSKFDSKVSFHLVYKAYNKDKNESMCDEIRRINDNLYIGLGYLTWNLGTYNPTPFVLYGESAQWVGPDKTDNKITIENK